MMENPEVNGMKSGCKRRIELPEEILAEIVARLPFRSIARFKAVCKGWRSLIESTYFRRLFVFAHRNSSSSWSLMCGTFGWSVQEMAGFYGCKRYGLPRRLGSYIPPHGLVDKYKIIACADGLVLLRTVTKGEAFIVGSPVLRQWVQLPPHPWKGISSSVQVTGLVTRVEDSVVLEYKVVCMDNELGFEVESLIFEIYSSLTGMWTRKKVRCSRLIVSLSYQRCLSLNKMLHWLDNHYRSRSNVGAIVAYDFYAADDQQQCRVIPFPDQKACFRRAYTTSGGFLIYIDYINKIHLLLRLWRLEEYTSDSGRWQLTQEINLTSFGCDHRYFPVAMHPSETHIIYMGNPDKALVSIDLKTHKLTLHTKSSAYRDTMVYHYLHTQYLSVNAGFDHDVFYTPQFTLPTWMGSVPRAPSI
ncbi:F-box domain [Arabidopsis suecica]|uniref:F-box domain n=1 Tax=Arabidopsis suecica TaxID=45249 RepID=A0A8T2CCT3_ARASU|nr:F-box domain [Arabidopsis suecica]